MDATCTAPKTCSECGETEGEPLGHDMLPPDDRGAKVCSRGDYAEGTPEMDGFSWIYEDGTVTLSGSGPMPKIEGEWPWPRSVDNVIIGNGLTSVSEESFSVHSFLNLTILDGVTTIEDYAFFDCERLESVTLPESLTTIGSGAFSYCPFLTSFYIPASVTTIEDAAFEGDTMIEAFTVAPENTSYKSVDGVLYSADMATLVAYPSNGSTEYTVPDGVTNLGFSAFFRCFRMTSITLPAGLTEIGDKAFYGCKALTSLTLPDSVTKIGSNAFYNCQALTSITIPIGVTSIGDWSFNECKSLTDIYFEGTAEQWAAISTTAEVPETATVHYGA